MLAIGVFPAPLYNILPYAVDYHPYDASHVTGQMQLLIFAMLAFVVLIRMRLYPPEIPSVVLNSDWFYRRLAQIGRPVLRVVMMVFGVFFLCQMRGFIEAFWFVIDKLVRSPAAGPTIPGPAALVQLILLLACTLDRLYGGNWLNGAGLFGHGLGAGLWLCFIVGGWLFSAFRHLVVMRPPPVCST